MSQSFDSIFTSTVFDRDGDKVGKVGQLFLDDATSEPSWVTVHTGLFGLSESFVPLDGAAIGDDRIDAPYSKDAIVDAPRIDEHGHLSPADERALYEHYGRDYPEPPSGAAHTELHGDVFSTSTREAYSPDRAADDGWIERGPGQNWDERESESAVERARLRRFRRNDL